MELFGTYESALPRYDELFNRAGMAINEAAALYAQFVAEILRMLQSPISLPDVELPVYDNGQFVIGHASGVLFDEYDRFPVVVFAEGMTVPFSELSVLASDIVSSHIFMEIKAADVYRTLNRKGEDAP